MFLEIDEYLEVLFYPFSHTSSNFSRHLKHTTLLGHTVPESSTLSQSAYHFLFSSSVFCREYSFTA